MYTDHELHDPSIYADVLYRLDNVGIRFGELMEIFCNDTETLAGWLNSFVYMGAVNWATLKQDAIRKDDQVWDGTFQASGNVMLYVGANGPCGGTEPRELLLEDEDVIYTI